MLHALNERLKAWKEADKLTRKWNSHIRQLERELNAKQNEVSVLQKKLSEEKADVEKLTSLSLHTLFYTVLGKNSREQTANNTDQ